MGGFVSRPGAPQDITSRSVNPDAPANLWQQGIGASLIKREAVWPRNYGASGSSGANTFNAKVAATAHGYRQLHPEVSEEEALALAQVSVATGEPMPQTLKAGNLKARTGASDSRAGLDDERRDNIKPHQAEIERHNKMMESLRKQQLEISRKAQERMQHAQDNKDWVAVERLNEQRYWHDQLMLAFGAIDKPDMFSDEQQKAFSDAMGIVERLGERPITDDEKSWFRSQFGIAERPRYKYEPRKPLPSGAPNTMQRKPKAGDSTKPTDAGASGNVPTVNSAEEYDKLPKGTRYKDSQGNEGVKR
jgi:hypothetical protein